jgi:antitoxin component YwqK of YwqJK toxin-antitoxin module
MNQRILIASMLTAFAVQCGGGQVKELKDKKGRTYAKKTYTTDDKDREVPQMVEYDKQRDGKFERKLLFDDAGRFTSITIDRDQNGKHESVVHYNTDDKGMRTKTKVERFRPDGTMRKRIYFFADGKKKKSVEHFDAEGNLSREVIYNENGKPTTIRKGDAASGEPATSKETSKEAPKK